MSRTLNKVGFRTYPTIKPCRKHQVRPSKLLHYLCLHDRRPGETLTLCLSWERIQDSVSDGKQPRTKVCYIYSTLESRHARRGRCLVRYKSDLLCSMDQSAVYVYHMASALFGAESRELRLMRFRGNRNPLVPGSIGAVCCSYSNQLRYTRTDGAYLLRGLCRGLSRQLV